MGIFAVSVQAPPWSKRLFPAVRGNVCEADKRDRRRERLSAKLTEGIYIYPPRQLRVVIIPDNSPHSPADKHPLGARGNYSQ